MRKRLWFTGVMLLSLSACATPPAPPPCACQQAIDDLSMQAELFHQALKDKGNLRQQLKICQEAPK